MFYREGDISRCHAFRFRQPTHGCAPFLWTKFGSFSHTPRRFSRSFPTSASRRCSLPPSFTVGDALASPTRKHGRTTLRHISTSAALRYAECSPNARPPMVSSVQKWLRSSSAQIIHLWSDAATKLDLDAEHLAHRANDPVDVALVHGRIEWQRQHLL